MKPRKKTGRETVPAPLVTHVMIFKFHDTVYKNKNLTKQNSADPNNIYMSEGKELFYLDSLF